MAELKPCPFCGTKSTNGGIYPDKIAIYEDADSKSCNVICLNCGIATDWYASEKKAVKAWNRRTNK